MLDDTVDFLIHAAVIHILDAVVILQVFLDGQVIIKHVVLQTKTYIFPNIISVVRVGLAQDLNHSAV